MPQPRKPKTTSRVAPAKRSEGSKPKFSSKRKYTTAELKEARRVANAQGDRLWNLVEKAAIVASVVPGVGVAGRAAGAAARVARGARGAKALQKTQSKARVKAQAKKDNRISTYRAKQDAARLRTEARVAKAKQKQRGIATEKRVAAQEAEQLRYEKMARARKVRGRFSG